MRSLLVLDPDVGLDLVVPAPLDLYPPLAVLDQTPAAEVGQTPAVAEGQTLAVVVGQTPEVVGQIRAAFQLQVQPFLVAELVVLLPAAAVGQILEAVEEEVVEQPRRHNKS